VTKIEEAEDDREKQMIEEADDRREETDEHLLLQKNNWKSQLARLDNSPLARVNPC